MHQNIKSKLQQQTGWRLECLLMWSFRGQTALLVIQTHESSRMHPGYTKEAGKPQTIFFLVFPKRQSSSYPFPTLYSQKGQIFHFSSTAGSTFLTLPSDFFWLPHLSWVTLWFQGLPCLLQGRSSPWSVSKPKLEHVSASFRVTSPGSLGSSSSSACQTSLAESFLRPQRSKSSRGSWVCWRRQARVFRVSRVWSWSAGWRWCAVGRLEGTGGQRWAGVQVGS